MRLQLRWLACAMGVTVAANAQKPIPVRSLTPAVGTDSGVIQFVENIRPLANGKVLVNDDYHGRVILFEQTLKRFTTIMDTAAGAPTMYPQHSGAVILRYLADSTVFLDAPSKAFVVISPSGRIVRTMALPGPTDARSIMTAYRGVQGYDNEGRFVFAAPLPGEKRPTAPASSPFFVYWSHLTYAIIRRDPAKGRTDTLGTVVSRACKYVVPNTDDVGPASQGRGECHPLPTVDDWTMLADGTVAIVRGHDYHIDWVHPDGRKTSSPKMPFDWLRIPPDQKQHMADSINAAIVVHDSVQAAKGPQMGVGGVIRPGVPSSVPSVSFEADSLPDYYPPVRSYTTQSDPDGNVWVLPTTSVLADGGLIYDVVNRKGEIVERVKLPPNRRLLAVGYRGIVYMAYTPKGLVRLERATIIR